MIIENLKNFIRHGKQARDAKSPPDQAVSNVHAQQQRFNDYGSRQQQPIQQPPPVHYGITEPPAYDQKQPLKQQHAEAYSVAAGGDNRNVAAKAGHAAAHAADQHQKNAAKQSDKQKQVDKDVLERIVAEEREAKGKLPRYPGLDRYQLIEKMGDGAFSNVYRARDLKGIYTEVAIKVVRKFEMNATQVCIS
ncbi:hypothetical protein K461DRAFT_154635 [Myriangium duriaei CBS 260.36]|uniref:Protein kinase domain-containing protein n=1 Tax=Myriangium duriaei CBS 260.36 TaxID=1168546 RepID=A0A9P4MEV5_9PEZI|nr:hypothetical protein K461DRAFT_154635 [Myriangium duriaei CBS 260.36]